MVKQTAAAAALVPRPPRFLFFFFYQPKPAGNGGFVGHNFSNQVQLAASNKTLRKICLVSIPKTHL